MVESSGVFLPVLQAEAAGAVTEGAATDDDEAASAPADAAIVEKEVCQNNICVVSHSNSRAVKTFELHNFFLDFSWYEELQQVARTAAKGKADKKENCIQDSA
eukprot:6492646-Amphidinium_carterae.1